jgi:hypothetical protein
MKSKTDLALVVDARRLPTLVAFEGAEQRSLAVGAHSALRFPTRRGCLSAVSEANAASSAARPQDEQHRAPEGRLRRRDFLCLLSLARQRK